MDSRIVRSVSSAFRRYNDDGYLIRVERPVENNNNNNITTCALGLLLAASASVASRVEDGQQAYLAGDHQRAYDILRPLAEQGDGAAQVSLGILYERGHGVPQDTDAALAWYTRAAEQDLPAVQHDLAVKLYSGNGIAQNYEQAARWWRRAAANGVAESAYSLGLMYSRGIGLPQDNFEALRWFAQAAQAGHPRAQYSLAVMHAFGDGMPPDFETAALWFRRSAEQGMAEAQYNLGLLLERGRGVPINVDEARDWYQKAAQQGIAPAQARLQVLDAAPAERTSEIAPANWLLGQNAQHFTLQLASVSSEQSVKQFLAALPEGDAPVGYLQYQVDGADRFAALYGAYPTRQQAENARDRLPHALRQQEPWIRSIGDLQKLARSQ